MAKKNGTTTRGGLPATQATGRAVAVANDEQALTALMTEDAGRGYEEANKDSFAIPFLRILQDLSPQVKSKMTGYVQGAKPGHVFHTISRELFESVRVIPCYYSQAFIEWVPRSAKGKGNGGSGFVASHPATTPLASQTVRDEMGRALLPNGNQLVDTRQHFVLLVRDDGSCDQALIALSGSQIKASKNWMTRTRAPLLNADGSIRVAQPPLWARSYELRVVEQANDKGSWYGWEVADAFDNFVLDHYTLARAFNAQMRSGAGPRVSYDEESLGETVARDNNRGNAPIHDLDDNDIGGA